MAIIAALFKKKEDGEKTATDYVIKQPNEQISRN